MTIIYKELMSVGRVQTCVLNEIYNREIARLLFQPVPYIELECTFQSKNGESITGYLVNSDGKKDFKPDDKTVENFISLKPEFLTGIVRNIEIALENIKRPFLYNTSVLEQDCYKYFNISPDKTLSICQFLYDDAKALSYPRTESRFLSEEDLELAKNVYNKIIIAMPEYEKYSAEKNINTLNKNIFNGNKVTGHHGLIPNKNLELTATITKESIEYKVWKLIVDRFMMQWCNDAKIEKQKIEIECANKKIIATKEVLIDKGFLPLDISKKEHTDTLSKITSGDKIQLKNIDKLNKQTKSKPFYNQGTIIEFMENPSGKTEDDIKYKSIGTSATRHEIIKKLFARNYIITEKKHIRITKKGIELIERMKTSSILKYTIDTSVTTEWDSLLEEEPMKLVNNIKEVVAGATKELEEVMEQAIEKETLGKCPKCGKNIVEGEKSFYCEGYKEGCDTQISKLIMGNKITKEIVRDFLKNKETEFMTGINKNGDETVFKLVIAENDISLFYQNSEQAICKCPLCGKDVYISKKNYFCSGYKEGCKFSLWRNTLGTNFSSDMVRKLVKGEVLDNVKCLTKDKVEYLAGFKLENGEKLIKILYHKKEHSNNE